MSQVTELPQGLPLSQITNLTGTATNSPATVTLTSPATSISILNLDASASLFVNLTGATATSSSTTIPAGKALNYAGERLAHFSILSSASSSSYSLFAN
jgi:hypothetical protein